MNYRTIISVITEHTVSTVTCRYAIELAAVCNAELILYSAHAGGGNDVPVRRAVQHREQLALIAAGLGIPVTEVVQVGNIRTLLPKLVQERRADLVFYHLMPGEQYGSHLQRDTVHHLLRAICCDLAIMRVTSMVKPHPAHILVPLGSHKENGERRLRFITALATGFHAQILLLHITSRNSDQKCRPPSEHSGNSWS